MSKIAEMDNFFVPPQKSLFKHFEIKIHILFYLFYFIGKIALRNDFYREFFFSFFIFFILLIFISNKIKNN